MHSISSFKFITTNKLFLYPSSIPRKLNLSPSFNSSVSLQSPNFFLSLSRRKTLNLISSSSSEAEALTETEDEWIKRLPDKNNPLYSHSLPCIEAWLRKLGFYQSQVDRALWVVKKSDWHAHLSLDVTDIHIRYLKSGPGKIEKDVERRFSYALSREDIENAILGGP